MPDTILVGKNMTIISDGSPSNFDSTTYFPGEILLAAVKLKGTANDHVVIRHGSGTGEIISDFIDLTGAGAKDTLKPPLWCKPYMLASECTLTNGTLVVLEMA
jgi:hypothetical protein